MRCGNQRSATVSSIPAPRRPVRGSDQSKHIHKQNQMQRSVLTMAISYILGTCVRHATVGKFCWACKGISYTKARESNMRGMVHGLLQTFNMSPLACMYIRDLFVLVKQHPQYFDVQSNETRRDIKPYVHKIFLPRSNLEVHQRYSYKTVKYIV